MGRRGRGLGGGWRVCALLAAAYALACSQTTWEARLATPAERDEVELGADGIDTLFQFARYPQGPPPTLRKDAEELLAPSSY